MTELLDALRPTGVTDVNDSDLAKALYSSDASLYRVPPAVVVRPRHIEELMACVAVARELGAVDDAWCGGRGLAGNFGVEKGHYEVSVAVAEHELLPAVRGRSAEAVVLADGFSCRTQLENLADVRAVHLAGPLVGAAATRFDPRAASR